MAELVALTGPEPTEEPVNIKQQKQAPWSFTRDGLVLQPRQRAAFVEVFAGSGRLTKHMRAHGVDGWAVDWKDGRLVHETPPSSS